MPPKIESEKNKWVYLMDHYFKSIKYEKYVLESVKVFQHIIRGIEENIDRKSEKIVIFLPGFDLNEIQKLVNYLTNENITQLDKANHEMEQLLSRMNHLVGIKDPEEVIQKVEMPSDDWIKIADFFIKNEFPEFEIPTKQPLPDKGRQDQKNSLLYEVKHRALEWISSKIYNEKFIGKLCIQSFVNAILPNSICHVEKLSPSLVKYFIKWKIYEFSGVGNQMSSAKEDAALYAISRLLDINLKPCVIPSKTKLFSEIMSKIKLDKVSSEGLGEVYEMSFKLPSTGQVVRARGNSLYNAKQKTFLLSSKLLIVEKKLAIERLNKATLVKFYVNEEGDRLIEEKSNEANIPESPSEIMEVQELTDASNDRSSHTPTIVVNVPSVSVHEQDEEKKEEEHEALKKRGLDRIKPYLQKSSFKKLTFDSLLHKFLPKAILKSKKKHVFTINYKEYQWCAKGKTNREAMELAITSVFNEFFNIELQPTYFKDVKDYKERFQNATLTAMNKDEFTSTLVYQGTIFKNSATNKSKSRKGVIKKALAFVTEKYEEEMQLSNRVMLSKCLIDMNSSLVDRVKFVLDHFLLESVVKGSRFETPTEWILSPFERFLLDDVDNSIRVKELGENIFKATMLINNETMSTIDSSIEHAKYVLILRVFQQMEENEDTFIVVSKPITTLRATHGSSHTYTNELLEMDQKDRINYYRKRALDVIYGQNFINQLKRGYVISPSCILHNVLVPEKLQVMTEVKLSPSIYGCTIEVAGKKVTGRGSCKKDAKQDACRLAIIDVLKIDWDRACHGRK